MYSAATSSSAATLASLMAQRRMWVTARVSFILLRRGDPDLQAWGGSARRIRVPVPMLERLAIAHVDALNGLMRRLHVAGSRRPHRQSTHVDPRLDAARW